MTTHDLEVIEAMRKYGGGFVQALAEAAMRADATNLELIKDTWPAYWTQYDRLAANTRLRDKGREAGQAEKKE